MLEKIFSSIYTTTANIQFASRQVSVYLFNCTYVIGIRAISKRYSASYVLWCLTVNIYSTLYQPIGFVAGYITHMSEYSPGEFLFSLQVAVNTLTCSMKVVTYFLMLHRLDQANEILDKMDQRCVLDEEKHKIRAATVQSNRIYFILMVVYLGYATSSFLSAIYNKRPLYQNYYPYIDWHANILQYWIQVILEYISMFIACSQDVIVDGYPICYIIALRLHVDLLTERVSRLGNLVQRNGDEAYNELINCVEDHKTLLRYRDTISPLISITIFIQSLVMGIVLGLTLINIMLFSNLASGIASIMFMLAVSLEITPFSILCNCLVDDCHRLSSALFHSNWMDAELRYKKVLIYFLHNVQQPIIFTALNVFPITVATNINFVKFAFSVYTLVKQMNIAERFFNKD